jgi:hypothetical protein
LSFSFLVLFLFSPPPGASETAHVGACEDSVIGIRAELQATVEKSPATVRRTYVVVRRVSVNAGGLAPPMVAAKYCAAHASLVRLGARLRRSLAFIGTTRRDGRLARRETDNVGAYAAYWPDSRSIMETR